MDFEKTVRGLSKYPFDNPLPEDKLFIYAHLLFSNSFLLALESYFLKGALSMSIIPGIENSHESEYIDLIESSCRI
jgi:hypothetical protein